MSRHVCNIGANRRPTPRHASASRVRHETFDDAAAAAIDALDEARALVAPTAGRDPLRPRVTGALYALSSMARACITKEFTVVETYGFRRDEIRGW
ncbi:hypothetical protein WMF11_46225 [Sorangium sp. So ce295]|uniref:hypothetical protein n=1 Tax=Sorangium sp. So ce295 TaxID=3133295 RepID=UPI003F5DF780